MSENTQIILFALMYGVICGLVPLVYGIMKDQARIGVLGLIASAIGGLAFGLLLAVPVAAVFVYLVVRANRKERERLQAEQRLQGANPQTCPFCSQPVIDDASICPHCGHDLKSAA